MDTTKPRSAASPERNVGGDGSAGRASSAPAPAPAVPAAMVVDARRPLQQVGVLPFATWAWLTVAVLAPAIWLTALLVLPNLAWRWRAMHTIARLIFRLTGTPLMVVGLDNLPAGGQRADVQPRQLPRRPGAGGGPAPPGGLRRQGRAARTPGPSASCWSASAPASSSASTASKGSTTTGGSPRSRRGKVARRCSSPKAPSSARRACCRSAWVRLPAPVETSSAGGAGGGAGHPRHPAQRLVVSPPRRRLRSPSRRRWRPRLMRKAGAPRRPARPGPRDHAGDRRRARCADHRPVRPRRRRERPAPAASDD